MLGKLKGDGHQCNRCIEAGHTCYGPTSDLKCSCVLEGRIPARRFPIILTPQENIRMKEMKKEIIRLSPGLQTYLKDWMNSR